MSGVPVAWPQEAPADAAGYADHLVREAERLNLDRDSYWHVLVHYRNTLSGVKSLVDDPKFFLAPDGRTNPRAELHATIRAFFDPPCERPKHPVCRFVARYHWLRQRLNIDPSRLPVGECAEIFQNVEAMRAGAVSLIFPAAHMNSPASMFGHTLLTIETGNRSALLAHAVNYSAITTDTFGPLYTFRGIFGLYRGYFSILPYYAKIQEYGDFDHRDIWEYRLNFSPEEISRMLYHIYELNEIYSYYYFFDENCSYSLLFLLDAARPGLGLSGEFYSPIFTWVIPVDTIRGVEASSLVDAVIYRPSRVSTVRHYASRLSAENRRFALDVARGMKKPEDILTSSMSAREKIIVCDLVSEYVRYRYSKGEMERSEYAGLFISTLRARSALGVGEGAMQSIREPSRPEKGHLSARASIGAGVREDGAYQEVKVRPAYHTLLDADEGYVEGAQIVFLDFVARFYDRERKARVERVDCIDIVSLSPRDEFFSSTSWKVNTGLRRRLFPDDAERMVFHVSPGAGLAWRIARGLILYGMIDAALDAAQYFEYNVDWAAGATAGALLGTERIWKMHLMARSMYYPMDGGVYECSAVIAQRFRTGANTSVMVNASRTLAHESGGEETAVRSDLCVSCNLFF